MYVTSFLEVFFLTKLQKIRDEVHDLDKKTRMMAGILNKLHSTPSDKGPYFFVSQPLYLNFRQLCLCSIACDQSSRVAGRIRPRLPRSSLQTSFGDGKTCGHFPCGTLSTLLRWSSL